VKSNQPKPMEIVQPTIEPTGVIIKSPQETAVMRQAGQVVAEAIKTLLQEIRPGMTSADLDAIAHESITGARATPSFKGYRGFPSTICVSINDEVVHGIPGQRPVREGDLVSLDVGAIVDGYQGDSAVTVGVGEISQQAAALLAAAEGSLYAGIQAARAGARMGDLSAAVQAYAESRGFSVVREYVGHGIGRALHEEPAVPNYGVAGRGMTLKAGLALAIEPMVNAGTWKTKVLPDNWTVVTQDGGLSAHFEHTIVITEGEAEVLTAR